MSFLRKAFSKQNLQKVGGETKRFLSKVSDGAGYASRKVGGIAGALDSIDKTGTLGTAARTLSGGLKAVGDTAMAGRQLVTGDVKSALQTAKSVGSDLKDVAAQGASLGARFM